MKVILLRWSKFIAFILSYKRNNYTVNFVRSFNGTIFKGSVILPFKKKHLFEKKAQGSPIEILPSLEIKTIDIDKMRVPPIHHLPAEAHNRCRFKSKELQTEVNLKNYRDLRHDACFPKKGLS